MTQPFYVSPEQLMKDRADFARKGIARGRSVIVLGYDGGIAFATENPSRALHKISEIYDRIGFGAVGKYNEFENLRVAGVRYADLRGYSYDRSDVTARGLANAYAQTLGSVFTTESKPLEVELAVAEVGVAQAQDQIYRLSYDGSVTDENGYVVMGGDAGRLTTRVQETWRAGLDLAGALRLAVDALSSTDGEPRTLQAGSLEVAVLERSRLRRAFRRLGPEEVDALVSGSADTAGGTGTSDGADGAEATDAADSSDPAGSPASSDPAGTGGNSGTADSPDAAPGDDDAAQDQPDA